MGPGWYSVCHHRESGGCTIPGTDRYFFGLYCCPTRNRTSTDAGPKPAALPLCNGTVWLLQLESNQSPMIQSHVYYRYTMEQVVGIPICLCCRSAPARTRNDGFGDHHDTNFTTLLYRHGSFVLSLYPEPRKNIRVERIGVEPISSDFQSAA